MRTPVTLTVCGLAVVSFSGHIRAQPANDNFASRIVLTGTTLTTEASNIGATSEPGEPHSWLFTNSVWWEWTAPETGTLRVSVSATEFEPALMIYDLWDMNLNEVERSTLSPVGVTMLAERDRQYFFVVGGLDGGSGDFGLSMELSELPSNTNFASRIHLGSGAVQTNGWLMRYSGYGSAWYSWTAAKDGPVTFSVPERWFTLDVFSGNTESDMELLASSRGRLEIEGTQATIEAVAGATYNVEVGGEGNDFTLAVRLNRPPLVGLRQMPGSSPFLWQLSKAQAEVCDSDGQVLRVEFYNRMPGFNGYTYVPLGGDSSWPFQCEWTNRPDGAVALMAIAVDDQQARTMSVVPLQFPALPNNDAFADRLELSGSSLTITDWCAGSTIESWEAVPPGAYGGSVWYTWSAPFSGTVTLEAAIPLGPEGDRQVTLAVYTGSAPSQLSAATNGPSPLTFKVSAGTVYQLALYVYNQYPFRFRIAESAPPAVWLTGPALATQWFSGNQVPLTAEVTDDGFIEQVDFYLDSALIGSVTNPPYTLLYTVPDVDHWIEEAFSAVVFDDHELSATSTNVLVRFLPRPPPNDTFTKAVQLTDPSFIVTVDRRTATLEPNEPNSDRSVWYSWTAPFSRVVTLKAGPPATDVSVAVFTGSALEDLVLVGRGTPNASDGYQSRISFPAVAGMQYKIALCDGGWWTDLPMTLELVPSAPPSISLTSPASQPSENLYLSGTSVLFSADATDSDGSIQRVDFYADGSMVGTAYNFPYQCTGFFTNEYGTSWHSAWAIATDNDGLSQRSDETRFEVYADPPVNDLFANRIPLIGSFLTVTGTTASARSEPGEPGLFVGGSVWWSWEAPANGPATIVLDGEERGANISVYRGTSISNLVAVTNGWVVHDTLPTALSFQAAAGQQYHFAVNYSQAFGGPVRLVIGQSPPPTVSITNPTNDAVFISGEPIVLSAVPSAPGGSVQEVAFYNEQNGVLLALVTNAPWSTPLFLTNSGGGPSEEYVELFAGVIDNHGLVAYSEPVMFRVIPRRPANDDFENRLMLVGCSVSITGSTVQATADLYQSAPGQSVWWSWTASQDGWVTVDIEGGASTYFGVFNGSVLTNLALVTSTNLAWYAAGRMTFPAISGTTYSIEVATPFDPHGEGAAVSWKLYCEAPSGVTIASPAQGERFLPGTGVVVSVLAETPGGPTPVVEIYVDTLLVQTLTNPPYLASLGAPTLGYHSVQARAIGHYGLATWSPTTGFGIFAPPPGNDWFAHRLPISGFLASVPAYSKDATREAGEPDPFRQPDYGTLWFTWTAPGSGMLKLQSADKWPSPFLSVWVGSTLSELQLMATNEAGISELVMPVTRGMPYEICCALSRSPLALFLETTDDPTTTRGGFTAEGLFHLEIETLLQQPWVIEASEDLEHWTALSTNTTQLNLIKFSDTESRMHQKRFYRPRAQQ